MNIPSSSSALQHTSPFFWVGPRISSVARLLFPCGPPTIGRFVIPIVVDAIDRGSIGSFAHISEEIDEAILTHPAITHGNTTATIVLISNGLGITAPTKHRLPRNVSSRAFHAVFIRWVIGADWSRRVRVILARITELVFGAFTTGDTNKGSAMSFRQGAISQSIGDVLPSFISHGMTSTCTTHRANPCPQSLRMPSASASRQTLAPGGRRASDDLGSHFGPDHRRSGRFGNPSFLFCRQGFANPTGVLSTGAAGLTFGHNPKYTFNLLGQTSRETG